MKSAGFVLVGGQNSRMGRDKARLPLNSRTLVEEVATAVMEAAGSVALVGRPEAFADLKLPCLPDLRPGLGPLAGLEAALAGSQAEYNLIVACDMPGIKAEWLQQLLTAARRSGALCAVAKDLSGRIHPLCAVYRNACLPFIQKALDARRLRLLDLIRDLAAVEVPVDEVIANVNTPEQWARWRALPA